MVRDTSSAGRPGWALFLAGWEQHHVPVASQQTTGTCHIWTGPATRKTEPATGAVVDDYGTRVTDEPVPVRLQQLMEQAETAGTQQVTTHRYRATLHRHVDEVGLPNVLEVVSASDPTMVGLFLPVLDILRGTLRWQRDLIVTDHL